MRRKLFTALLLGLCLPFFFAADMYANSEEILQKQKEVDDYLFVEHLDELEEKGITVTHTAPLENRVEIGIIPFNEENVQYLENIFGEDQIMVVEGQQAELMSQTNGLENTAGEETTSEKSVMNPIYLLAGAIVLAGGVIFLRRRKV